MTDAPYPADTRAKGWRFELDHERIRQSDTWALAAPEHRPWLLMLWMVAWEQTPCGSLPDDDALIAARIGMASKAFAKARDTLRRGWWKADDGRLYHAAITQHVLRMIDKRAKEAARKAGNRHPTPAPVPRDNTVTDGTRTSNTRTKKEKAPAPPALAVADLVAEGVDEQAAVEWLAIRKTKKLALTPLAWEGNKAEFAKAGLSVAGGVRKCILRGWAALEADWLKDAKTKAADVARSTVPPPETIEENRRRLDAGRMTPEERESADKAAKLAMSAIKNITPRMPA